MVYLVPSQGFRQSPAKKNVGSIAQLGEHLPYKQRVIGSSPIVPTRESNRILDGPVVQLVRTLACHARGRGFEPHPSRHYAQIAQSVEQGTENPCVGGSIPPLGTSKHCVYKQCLKLDTRHRDFIKVFKCLSFLKPIKLYGGSILKQLQFWVGCRAAKCNGL